jgi:hypothetical protein
MGTNGTTRTFAGVHRSARLKLCFTIASSLLIVAGAADSLRRFAMYLRIRPVSMSPTLRFVKNDFRCRFQRSRTCRVLLRCRSPYSLSKSAYSSSNLTLLRGTYVSVRNSAKAIAQQFLCGFVIGGMAILTMTDAAIRKRDPQRSAAVPKDRALAARSSWFFRFHIYSFLLGSNRVERALLAPAQPLVSCVAGNGESA